MKKKKRNAPPPPKQEGPPAFGWVIGALAALVLVMFADVLLSPRQLVVSQAGTDLWSVYPYFDFGFRHLREGYFALWNPHIFSGMPFIGESQSGLLYPINLIFLALPLDTALNVQTALHIFLCGSFMALWARHRGLHPVACGLAGAVLMFGGPVWMHVFPGHLGNIGAIAWAPLLFLAVDLQRKNFARGTLVGAFGLGMQMLVGQPQYVFYTGVALGIYCLAKGVISDDERGRLKACALNVAGLAVICVGGVALAAAELLTVLQASGESTRAGSRMAYEFAAMFSFPPENLLTLFAPGFFGNMTGMPYWGRCYLWEMSLFMSVTGLALAVCAVASKSKPRSLTWLCVAMFGVMMVLAFGAHSPHFRLFFDFVPGFNKFRGNSKFSFQAFLFAALLAGIGLDRLWREQRVPALIVRAFSAVAGVCIVVGIAVVVSSASGTAGWWAKIPVGIASTGELFSVPVASYSTSDFVSKAGAFAGQSMLVSGVIALLVSGLLWALPRWPYSRAVLVALAVVEMAVFARTNRPVFDLDIARHPDLQKFLNEHNDGSRVLLFNDFNVGMLNGSSAIWGYDSFKLKRYAEFFAWTQGQDPDTAQDVAISHLHPFYSLLRLKYVFVPSEKGMQISESPNPLPQLLLVPGCEVIQGRAKIFERMGGKNFDPRRVVILENPPEPAPMQGAEAGDQSPGDVKLLDATTDAMTIEADVKSPCVLLVTDPYSQSWRARPLAGSAQSHYDVMPADYILRGIPLAAGHHKLRLEYAPSGFAIGKWISAVSWLALLGWAGAMFSAARKTRADRANTRFFSSEAKKCA